ncbi:hypothetical protein [Otariodibacter oris]|uniref:Lipoprotein n=1 Tax=Otariodibacter oris TaxID=1032623 RepID=A0A420XFG2_9PAST|nr:hypothetical protein [Otariodibacter oris]QGM81506.1 hypothetical protein A6A10_08850 [Otariodibacter oris]RKR71112.1 hypothetical protein DES31_1691 [Otariodibacter oris]
MKKLLITLSVFLSACSLSDQEIRANYAEHYKQSDEYVAQFAKNIEGLSVEQLAIDGAKKDKAKMNGQSRMQIDQYMYIENVRPNKNQVIYEYSFNPSWWKSLGESKQKDIQNNMQRDLIYRTCSLRTVALAQEKGLEEDHKYYYDYPNKSLAFELKTNKEICLSNGFVR